MSLICASSWRDFSKILRTDIKFRAIRVKNSTLKMCEFLFMK